MRDGGRCLHGPFYSNPALDHGCTVLPSWKGYWRMNVSYLSDPPFLQKNEGELGKNGGHI